jgi:hypothetical protein
MKGKGRFSAPVVAAIRDGGILGVRAGRAPHRMTGIWAVVVEGRVFVRSWGRRSGGWYRTFLEEPLGAIQVGTREIRVRAVPTRSERLKALVSQAYREKYNTRASLKWVTGFDRAKSRRDTTTELRPV